jgi:hypothetical protein
MKYIYINESENRIVSISKIQNKELAHLLEFAVADDFDIALEVPSKIEGNPPVKIDGAITATEFLRRLSANYVSTRINNYPAIENQLDMLWHAMDADESKRLEPFYSTIKAVKDAAPKG